MLILYSHATKMILILEKWVEKNKDDEPILFQNGKEISDGKTIAPLLNCQNEDIKFDVINVQQTGYKNPHQARLSANWDNPNILGAGLALDFRSGKITREKVAKTVQNMVAAAIEHWRNDWVKKPHKFCQH